MTNTEVFPIVHGGFTATTKPEPAPNSDLALAIAAGKGDIGAFEKLYERHNRRVYSLCLRMTQNAAEAEDLAQEAFIQLFRKIGSFRGDSAFTTWLHRLTVNVVLNARKSETRRQSRIEEPDEEQGGIEGVAGVVGSPLAPGDLIDLEQAMTRLPPGAKRVFVLHDVQGYKHEEIAEMLGVTTGATKAQLHRARLLLREAMNR